MVTINKKNKEPFAKVTFVSIDQHHQGQRIDNYLIRHFKGVPKSRIYRLLRKGEVRVNKRRIKATYKLNDGDELRLPPVRTASRDEQVFKLPDWLLETLNKPIFEDESLIVINKPQGLAVHGGTGLAYGLIEALRQHHPDWPFLELVHRIDRETSGCIVLAKSRAALKDLHLQFRREQGSMEKSYLAIVHGHLYQKTQVSHALQSFQNKKGHKSMVVDKNGQSAKSTFIPVRRFKHPQYGKATEVQIELETGRMHQARVHAASLDLPILGDKVYGDWSQNRLWETLGVKRCLLHAQRYQISHPSSKETLHLIAKVPPDYAGIVNALESLVVNK